MKVLKKKKKGDSFKSRNKWAFIFSLIQVFASGEEKIEEHTSGWWDKNRNILSGFALESYQESSWDFHSILFLPSVRAGLNPLTSLRSHSAP